MNFLNLDGPPPPPHPQPMQGGGPNALAPMGPQGPGPQPGGAPDAQGGTPGQPQRLPAPDHGQTVASLRHFDAISAAMKSVLSEPSLGRASVKSKIIDAVTRLVAGRIISPAQAVAQLSDVPDDPQGQRKWLMGHYTQSMQAAASILDHHVGAHKGMPEEMIERGGGPDSHMDTMASLGAHYGGRR